jgi:Ribbon-helix-helix protein, copG family
MHRTNLYLTEEQERRLDARARASRLSRSAYVRRIIDRALDEPEPISPDVEARLTALADAYEEIVGDLFDDDPDLRIDR